MKPSGKMFLVALLVVAFTTLGALSLSAAGSGEKGPTGSVLEYSVFYSGENTFAYPDEKDDVVAQYILKSYGVRISDIFNLAKMTFKERMNLYVASNDLPDVVVSYNDVSTVPATGRYAMLEPMIRQYVPNYLKWVPEDEWGASKYQGKMWCLTSATMTGDDPQFKDDPYALPGGTWAGIYVDENTLRKAGYSFTPLVDVYTKANQTGKKLAYADLKITPELKAPDDVYAFFKKIKDAYRAEGKDVIPFTMPIWLEPHFGYTFGLSGWWKYDPATRKVTQFLADDNAKAYWQFMNRLYTDGLIDPDFAIQKMEQLHEKLVSRRAITGMWDSNWADVQAALKADDPNNTLRVVRLPPGPGAQGIDPPSKTFLKFYIRQDYKDIPRLLKFFNYTLSEDFADLVTWGPAELGLWEIKDGKKVWKSADLLAALKANNADFLKNNYYKYGLGNSNTVLMSRFWNNTAPMISGVNPRGWERSYPRSIDLSDFNYQGAFVTAGGNDSKGYLSGGADELTTKPVDFTYGEFEQQYSAKLFAAKTPAEFEKSWGDVLAYFNSQFKFPETRKAMEAVFQSRGFTVVSQ